MLDANKLSHPWRSDITGLRALAVLPVLIFHAFPNMIPGGFFGVDVFFVISGYLISGIIFRSLMKGSFSYITFYAKRIKRIIPNLLLVLSFCMVVGWIYLTPTEYENLGKHITSSAFFSENFRLISEVGYFTEDALRKPLLHLWSLAIEEQFYIVFPIICSVIWVLSRSKMLLWSVVLVITLCSFEACIMANDKSFVFYFPLTRFWELGAGIVLSYLENFEYLKSEKISPKIRHVMSALGIVAIIIPMFAYSSKFTHPGFITVIPVLGAVCTIASSSDAFLNKYLLSFKPVAFIGLISYSLYLWHWPLLAFLFLLWANAPAYMHVLALVVSFIAASVIYVAIENPIRHSKTLFKIPVAIILLVLLVLTFTAGKYIRNTHGADFRPIQYDTTELDAVRLDHEWKAYNEATTIYFGGRNLPATLQSNIKPSVFFLGDSHVAQYFMRAQVLSKKYNKQTAFYGTKIWNGQPGLEDANKFLKGELKTPFPQGIIDAVFADPDIKTIVLALRWLRATVHWHDRFSGCAEYLKEQLKLHPEKKLFILLDYPQTDGINGQQGETDPLVHINRLHLKVSHENFTISLPKDDIWTQSNQNIIELFGETATYIDPTPYIWIDGKCDLLHWYKDDDHLRPSVLKEEGIWLDEVYQ